MMSNTAVFYTAERIAALLQDWETVCSLASSVRIPKREAIPSRNSSEDARSGRAHPFYQSPDWKEVQADLLYAGAEALEGLSLEWWAVNSLMKLYPLSRLTEIHTVTSTDVANAFRSACQKMSAFLEPPETPDGDVLPEIADSLQQPNDSRELVSSTG